MNRKSLTAMVALITGLAAVALVALFIGAASPERVAQAQSAVLLEENFDYGSNPGTLVEVSSGNWVSHSGTSGPVQYTPNSLSMPKYKSSGIGGAAVISTSGREDVNRTFLTQTSGTIYYAALVQVIAARGGGDYFLHFKDASTGFAGRLHARDNSGVLQFGVAAGTETATYTGNFSYNQTYLVVVRYTFGTPREAALYVLTAPVPIEPTPLITSTSSSGPANIRAIAIRQGSGTPAAMIDGIRVATTWEGVIGYTGEVSATKSVTPHTAVPRGGTVTYTVVLKGRAVDDAVLFTDTLPAEVDFGGWIEQPEGATVSNDKITWSGTLTAGTAITFAFTAQHVGNYGDVVTNTAEFSGTEDIGSAQA
ncbi:MAG: hypothetical protein ACUVR6_10355, partial [Anaerolineae bacterium]